MKPQRATTIHIYKYRVNLFIEKVSIALSTSSNLSVLWKTGSSKIESPQYSFDSASGTCYFNQKMTATSTIYYDTIQNKFIEKKSLIAVLIDGAKGKKIAGLIETNLTEILTQQPSEQQSCMKLTKCPDLNATISFKYELSKIEELKPIQELQTEDLNSQYDENSTMQISFAEESTPVFRECQNTSFIFKENSVDDKQFVKPHETSVKGTYIDENTPLNSDRSKSSLDSSNENTLSTKNSKFNEPKQSPQSPFSRKIQESASIGLSDSNTQPLQELILDKENMCSPLVSNRSFEKFAQFEQAQMMKLLAEQLEQATEEVKNLKESLQARVSSENKLQNNLIALQALCNQYQAQNQELEICLSKEKVQQSNLKNEVAALRAINKDLESAAQKQDKSLASKAPMEQVLMNLQQAEKERAELQKRVSMLSAERTSLQTELRDLQDEYESALDEVTRDKSSQLHHAQQKIQQLELQHQAQFAENMRLTEELKQKFNELEVCRQEISQHSDEVDNLRNRVRDLQKQIVDEKLKAQDSLIAKTAEVENYKASNIALNDNLVLLKSENKKLEGRLQDSMRDNETLKQKLEKLRQESASEKEDVQLEFARLKRESEQTIEELRSQLENSTQIHEKKLEALRGEIKAFEKSNEQLKASNEELKAQLQAKEEVIEEFRALQKINSTKPNGLVHLEESGSDSVASRLKALEQENGLLKAKIDDLLSLKTKIEEKHAGSGNMELVLLKDQKDFLLVELMSLKAELFEAKTQLKNGGSTELEELREKTKKHEEERQNYEKQINSLRETIREIEREKNAKAAICKRQQEQIEFESRQRQARENEIRSDADFAEKRRQETEQTLFALKAEYGRQKAELEDLKLKLSSKESEIIALQEERDKLKKKHEQILEDSERLLQSYNDLSQQRINENEATQSYNEKYLKSKELNEKLSSTLKTNENRINELKEEVSRLELVIKEKDELINKGLAKVGEVEAESLAIQSKYMQEISFLEEQIRSLNYNFDTYQREAKIAFEKLENEREDAAREAQTYRAKNLELVETIENLREKNRQLNGQISDLEDSKMVVLKLKQQMTELEAEHGEALERLNLKISAQKQEIEALQAIREIHETEKSYSQKLAQERDQETETRCAAFNNSLQELQEQYSTQVTQLESELEVTSRKLAYTLNELESAKRELSVYHREAKLSSSKQNDSAKVRMLKKENAELQDTIDRAIDELQNARAQLQKNETALKSLHNHLRDSEAELVLTKQKIGNALNTAFEIGGSELVDRLYSSLQ